MQSLYFYNSYFIFSKGSGSIEKTKYDGVFVDGEDIYRFVRGKYKKLCKWIDNVGYYMVSFKQSNKRKYVRVHRIIAETLIPNPDGYPQVNHIDGNKLNNQIDNLEWCSNSYNTQQGYDKNLYHSHHRSHAIIAINKETKQSFEFPSIRSCAEALGLNRKTITGILKGTKKNNNYQYEFEYIECVSTIPDECMGVGLEISTSDVLGNEASATPKHEAA